MSELACARVLIAGRVQGVGFRYFVTSHAETFNVTGYVRNLENGVVEVEVEGEKQIVFDFLNSIRTGPRNAQISEFQTEWKQYKKQYDQFFVKY